MTDNQIEVSSLQHQFISKYSSDNIRKSLNLSKKISNQNRHSDSEAKYYYDLGIEKLDLADILCDPDTRDNDCHKGCLFYIEAIDYFTQAIAINPLCAEFYLKRGHAEHSLIIWQPSTAHSCLEFWDAIANNLENINLRADLERKATEDINQALKINPQYIDAYLERTYFNYINLGYDTDSVISDINQVLAMNIDTHNINTYLKLAEIKSICLDDYIGAILDYSQIITIDPKNIDAYLRIAEFRFAMGNYQELIKDCDLGISIAEARISNCNYIKTNICRVEDLLGRLNDLRSKGLEKL